MKLSLSRIKISPGYTIGTLSIDGVELCDTLEDTDRGLKSWDTVQKIQRNKVLGNTAIPYGSYEVIINWSNKFKQYMPLLLNVPGFSGVRIHTGNTPADTNGCILVGKHVEKKDGVIIYSRDAYSDLFEKLQNASKNEKIILVIT